METEKSCGAIVFFGEGDGRKYLLLKHSNNYFGFPKGRVEAGESEEETARREIFEEIGILMPQFVPEFKESISYFYTRSGKTMLKEVFLFLAESKSQEIKISDEHTGFEWASFSEASEKIAFPNSKAVLKKAEAFLNSKFR
jgi:8-oxo-dGTP pyrophosphatase MutT (NUDIX family)